MTPDECKRPYDLRKRKQSSDRNRAAALQAAKGILSRDGFLQLTMAAIAKESGLTRQTLHNLFGAKVDVIEAHFDDIAYRAGMQNMRVIMQSSDPAWMTGEYLRLMVSLWSRDRVLIQRVHGLRAIDPELGAALERRDQRKRMVIGKILGVLEKRRGIALSRDERHYHQSILQAFTSFEIYEQLAQIFVSVDAVSEVVLQTVSRALNLDLSSAP